MSEKQYPREFLIELGTSYGEMIYDLAHDANSELMQQMQTSPDEDYVSDETSAELVRERMFFMLHVADRIAFMAFGAAQREPFALSTIRSVLTKIDPKLGSAAQQFNEQNNLRAQEYAAAKTVVGDLMQPDSLTGMYADKMSTILGQPINAKVQFMFSMEATNLFKTQMEILGKYIQD